MYIGIDNGIYHDNSLLNNAGTIISEAAAIDMFGDQNQVNNTGTIAARNFGVAFEYGTGSQLINFGDISAATVTAVALYGTGCLLENTGTITSGGFDAVVGGTNAFTIHNSGIITGVGNAINGSPGVGDVERCGLGTLLTMSGTMKAIKSKFRGDCN